MSDENVLLYEIKMSDQYSAHCILFFCHFYQWWNMEKWENNGARWGYFSESCCSGNVRQPGFRLHSSATAGKKYSLYTLSNFLLLPFSKRTWCPFACAENQTKRRDFSIWFSSFHPLLPFRETLQLKGFSMHFLHCKQKSVIKHYKLFSIKSDCCFVI